MYIVVKIDHEKETAILLFENESFIQCELFIDTLEDKTNIEIVEKY